MNLFMGVISMWLTFYGLGAWYASMTQPRIRGSAKRPFEAYCYMLASGLSCMAGGVWLGMEEILQQSPTSVLVWTGGILVVLSFVGIVVDAIFDRRRKCDMAKLNQLRQRS